MAPDLGRQLAQALLAPTRRIPHRRSRAAGEGVGIERLRFGGVPRRFFVHRRDARAYGSADRGSPGCRDGSPMRARRRRGLVRSWPARSERRAQVEEQRGIGRALSALQRLQRPARFVLVHRDRCIDDAQVGMSAGAGSFEASRARAAPARSSPPRAGPRSVHRFPLGLAQRLVAHSIPKVTVSTTSALRVSATPDRDALC